MTALRIGTRGSPLARWQAAYTQQALRSLNIESQIVIIRTHGDDLAEGSAEAFEGRGIFVKELELALSRNEVDIAVHSAKDVPSALAPGLELSGVCRRGSVEDCLVSRGMLTLAELPSGARVGTTSPRRQAQLLRVRPDLELMVLRGNVDTRVRKVDEGACDAVVLAKAGLERMELSNRIAESFDPSRFLPSPGQGFVVLESRSDDVRTRDVVRGLDVAEARAELTAERALLADLDGGCQAPIGAWARPVAGVLLLDAAVFSVDGGVCLWRSASRPVEAAEALGRAVAAELLAAGAAEVLAKGRGSKR
jgi:hydroxymethylbilane synthase